MNKANFEESIDHLVQLATAEEELDVHRVTLIRWGKKGIAPMPLKIGGRWFMRRSDLQALKAGEWGQGHAA